MRFNLQFTATPFQSGQLVPFIEADPAFLAIPGAVVKIEVDEHQGDTPFTNPVAVEYRFYVVSVKQSFKGNHNGAFATNADPTLVLAAVV